jgi:hypothetical protein
MSTNPTCIILHLYLNTTRRHRGTGAAKHYTFLDLAMRDDWQLHHFFIPCSIVDIVPKKIILPRIELLPSYPDLAIEASLLVFK